MAADDARASFAELQALIEDAAAPAAAAEEEMAKTMDASRDTLEEVRRRTLGKLQEAFRNLRAADKTRAR